MSNFRSVSPTSEFVIQKSILKQKDEEINEMKAKLQHLTTGYNELLLSKMSLETEITTYRNLLDCLGRSFSTAAIKDSRESPEKFKATFETNQY